MKLATAHPSIVAVVTALVTSVVLPAVLYAGTGAAHAFIGSLTIRDPDGIHIHDIAPALVWPAFGVVNFVAFGVVALLVAAVLRKRSRRRVNATIVILALVWCVLLGAIVAFQTVHIEGR